MIRTCNNCYAYEGYRSSFMDYRGSCRLGFELEDLPKEKCKPLFNNSNYLVGLVTTKPKSGKCDKPLTNRKFIELMQTKIFKTNR